MSSVYHQRMAYRRWRRWNFFQQGLIIIHFKSMKLTDVDVVGFVGEDLCVCPDVETCMSALIYNWKTLEGKKLSRSYRLTEMVIDSFTSLE